ncbi:MAG: phosphotyrosine protein phosphatase [Nonlabens sp.]|uniref:phosphotyrosine protein phosphatase n=1 Tax=Nonlabens sp. TaxID=1888209 RepID=UPI003EF3B273
MSILFICSANKDRSKTAEDYYSAQYPKLQFESAGTNRVTCEKLGTHYMTQELLENATQIFVMEPKHLEAIRKEFGNGFYNKTTVLDIPDIYKYGSKELIEILKEKVDLVNLTY